MEQLSFLKESIDYKDVTTLVEDFETNGVKQKRRYITGPFLQGNVKNKNGRIYPTEMLAETIDRFNKTQMRGVGCAGELSHPLGVDVNPDRISHYITELKLVGNNGMGKAMIASTPKGQIVEQLLNDGMILGVSTRGLGKLAETANGKMVSDFELVTIDIVTSPSGPDCYVDSLVESLQYIIDRNTGEIHNSNNIEQIVEAFRKSLQTLPKKQEAKKQTFYESITKLMSNLERI